jgi:hypothetical protein
VNLPLTEITILLVGSLAWAASIWGFAHVVVGALA